MSRLLAHVNIIIELERGKVKVVHTEGFDDRGCNIGHRTLTDLITTRATKMFLETIFTTAPVSQVTFSEDFQRRKLLDE